MFENLHAAATKPQRLLIIDIECTAAVARVWGLFDQNISPVNGQLVAPGRMICFAARWYDEPASKTQFFSEYHDGRRAMLDNLHRLLCEADVVVGWNSTGFDLRHINRELLVAGYTPPSPYKQIDLLRVSRGLFAFASQKLEFVAQQLLGSGKVKHQGFQLWLDCESDDPAVQAKAWATMRRYNIGDVTVTARVFDRLRPWVRQHPHAGLHSAAPDACTNCGKAGPHEYVGIHRTSSQAYDRFRCKCGTWLRGTKPLLEPRSSVRAA